MGIYRNEPSPILCKLSEPSAVRANLARSVMGPGKDIARLVGAERVSV